LEATLGAGEREAIALAAEVGGRQIVIDDGPARRVAAALGLRVVGTVGVVLIAKQLNLVPCVRSVLESLVETGFRLRLDIVERVLDQAGESR
jgi:predicted nucleic acid-binding protein